MKDRFGHTLKRGDYVLVSWNLAIHTAKIKSLSKNNTINITLYYPLFEGDIPGKLTTETMFPSDIIWIDSKLVMFERLSRANT